MTARKPGLGRAGRSRAFRRRAGLPRFAVAAVVLWPVLPTPKAVAQEPAAPEDREVVLRVFLDCQTHPCDFDFLRREIPFVNYVRDRQDADVHVMVTSQPTGGGGRSFTLDFIGRRGFEELDDRLQVSVRPNLAEGETLARLARAIKLGLMRYVARTPDADRLRIVFEEEGGGQAVAGPEDDPWNFWVFRASLRGSFNGEDRRNFLSAFGSFSADRVTEGLKIELGIRAGAGINLRLFRGLSLDLFGDASRVRDQINLPAGDATEEDVLLRIRELQTGFEYGFSFGFSYTFGSIFSNVVNPRF